jgi:hypothetical protein
MMARIHLKGITLKVFKVGKHTYDVKQIRIPDMQTTPFKAKNMQTAMKKVRMWQREERK